MNKTKPIGVRFRPDLLEKLKNEYGIDSPQKALVFYERFFAAHSNLAKEVKPPLRDKEAHEAALKAQKTQKGIASNTYKPRSLDELKSLCPAELTGLDRSEWIRTKRMEYGI